LRRGERGQSALELTHRRADRRYDYDVLGYFHLF